MLLVQNVLVCMIHQQRLLVAWGQLLKEEKATQQGVNGHFRVSPVIRPHSPIQLRVRHGAFAIMQNDHAFALSPFPFLRTDLLQCATDGNTVRPGCEDSRNKDCWGRVKHCPSICLAICHQTAVPLCNNTSIQQLDCVKIALLSETVLTPPGERSVSLHTSLAMRLRLDCMAQLSDALESPFAFQCF